MIDNDMKNLFKSAGSMFAFSNVNNENNSKQAKRETIANSRHLDVEAELLNVQRGNALSSRPMEFYD